MHAFNTVLVLTLLSLHWHLALAQAPTSTAPAAGRAPIFQNTPGVLVASPRNGMTVRQDTGIPFNVMLSSGRAVGRWLAHADDERG